MQSYVISLKRTPERLAAFRAFNDHSQFTLFDAIDGSQVDRGPLIASGVIDRSLAYTNGALGNALSHLELWKTCAGGAEAFTICEDDALLHRNYGQHTHSILQKLPGDWDLIYWGWNFDSVLTAQFLGTGMPLITLFDQNALRRDFRAYLSQPVEPTVLNLKHAFGTICYSVTPQGASKLLQRLLPLKDSYNLIQGMNRRVRNTTLDAAMNKVFEGLSGFACFPPVALTHNDRAASTVVGV